MKKIESLNYYIIVKSNLAYKFLKATSINFMGSTTVFFLIFKLFFRNSFDFEINGIIKKWPINTQSDLRLLRGEYESHNNKYNFKIGYEGIDLLFLKNLVKEDDIVIDIGANKGFYSLFFSSHVGINGKVYSFEANNKNYRILFNRVSVLWNLPNCIPFNYILSNSNDEQVSLSKPSFFDDGTGFFMTKSKKNNYTFSKTIDTILNQLTQSVKLIKIDVEGAEVIVLSGSKKILKKTEYVFVEVSETGSKRFHTSVEQLYNILKEAGFTSAYKINKSDDKSYVSLADNLELGNILFSKKKLL